MCGRSGFLSYRWVASSYFPKFVTTGTGQERTKIESDNGVLVTRQRFKVMSRKYQRAYIGHYDSEKYHKEMEDYRDGRRSSRPNGRTWCYLNDDELSHLLERKETELTKAAKKHGNALTKLAEVIRKYPPNPEDDRRYAQVIGEYDNKFRKEGLKAFIPNEKEQRVFNWLGRRLNNANMTPEKRNESIRLAMCALATMNPFMAIVLEHHVKYVEPVLRDRVSRLSPHLSDSG